MDKAILIPANPSLEFTDGRDAGNIIAHAVTIEKEGADFWRLVVPGSWEASVFSHAKVTSGYLYDVRKKGVTHVCEIEWIKSQSEVPFKDFVKYAGVKSKSRKYFERSGKSFYTVKIKNIFALKQVHRPEDFKKFEDGEPVVKVMNYCIVRDPHFVHHNRSMTRRQIISDQMAALLLRGRVTEQDVEDLFYYRLMKKARTVERQVIFRNAGRLDLLVTDSSGNFVVYELKKGVADPDALKQVRQYMRECAKKHGAKGIRGVILAQDAEPGLLDALRKTPNVKFKKYHFSIEMD